MEKKIYNIGVEATMDVIGGKWKPIILCNLRHGKQRPSELRRQISGISQKMLTQELRELERDHIVNRKTYNVIPPKVEYSLSDYGQTLSTLLDQLCSWGEMHVQTLQKNGVDVKLNSTGISGRN
ncbi:winged helix-turn-helix transcriptional regulator [Pediococcus acidilactici]|uniref:Helix-turn-helix domain-containing protein n=1 Tax=Pediococcus acidilactici TaxID=1254 RepID=A0AAW8YHV6_PEDAC|nr:helix-turn-helix domain-containing protein [Pediococcus acidilactici]MBS9399328.1 helix-turn-helix transcriptional regulator [Pediococcus acidilactici]MDD9322425.1 helix-turn-helix domain-containing protein [Pediococcus acidilactici]MDV2621405.1 helix-turn-helix domain-containing protein [Pediococcus acidilactici]NBI14966.1 helix-turn-helix transcriptional regulator [Pediococcus acidilactici]NFA45438.1 transcriptional regulator [Pediococcus acidilactici]